MTNKDGQSSVESHLSTPLEGLQGNVQETMNKFQSFQST